MHYTTLTALFLAVFLGNRYAWEEPILGAALLVFFLGFYGTRLGKRLLPQYHGIWQGALGSLILISTLLILGTGVYYIAFLPTELWTLFVLLTPVAVWLLTPKHTTHLKLDLFHARWHRPDRSSLLLSIAAVLLLVALFSLLQDVQIFDAVRSTWERMPHSFLWLAFLLFVTLGVLAFKGHERSLSLPLIATSLFCFVGIAAFVYPLGFGFDSFLHQATELHISTFETIDPKPFYYIGQYVQVLFASQAFTLPLLFVDRFILTTLTAVFLPMAWFFAASSLGSDKRAAIFSTLGIFLLPLSTFIVTTPQGLANLWTLLLVLLSLPHLSSREGLGLGPLWILGIAAAAIHPLAGIPALLYLVLITIRTGRFLQPETNFESLRFKISSLVANNTQRFFGRLRMTKGKHYAPRSSWRTLLFWLVAILGSISLPAVFIINSFISGLELNFSLAALAPTQLIERLNIDLIFQSGFNTFLDFVYLYGANVLLLFVVISGYVLWKERTDMPKDLRLPALMAVILFINYVVMSSAIDFTFLINYERSNYSGRLITLIFFFLIPYVGLFLARVWHTLKQQSLLPRVFAILILAGLLTSQLYLTYPRRDNYDTSRGFNTGTADILAVDYIEEHAPTDYIVLANQQVAAAAVLRYGFKQYYGDLFYYPIPTGGELYQSFLQMNERPTRDLMEEAMQLAEVNTAYYVVNDYWWQSERLVETAKINADDWIAIDSGRVHIFRYNHLDLR